MLEMIEKYAAERGISKRDAQQTFMQVITLKNIKGESIFLIGGTALTLGHGNPRFSEDVNLTGVKDPLSFTKYIEDGCKELAAWQQAKINILRPSGDKRTWRVQYTPEGGEKTVLHIDSQPYPAHSKIPIVITYPGIPPFIFNSPSLAEIMADKLMALAGRNYVGGRDIFDLWYHWLRKSDRESIKKEVLSYLPIKCRERAIDETGIIKIAHKRLSLGIKGRMKYEWERYLPAGFKKASLYDEMFSSVFDFLSGGAI